MTVAFSRALLILAPSVQIERVRSGGGAKAESRKIDRVGFKGELGTFERDLEVNRMPSEDWRILEAEESTPRRCCKVPEEKRKAGAVGESGFGWEIWRGAALGESDGVGVPEDPKVMTCKVSRWELSLS